MEHTSELVAEGKLIGETAYPHRARKYTEVEIEGLKIDFYDAKLKVIHEVKKSDKVEEAHIAQVKYYIYLLQKNGIEGVTGLIEYPKLRKTEKVTLESYEIAIVENWISAARQIMGKESCPPLLNKPVCRRCSYYDFCYAD
jgi:CRISPR-associated exonuclease Cas4